ncbi:MAG: hypothetical protein H7X91_09565 [Burkholderiales bacterium]|nr:hypothetical protein [Burkholderiales bacterium]
MTEAAKDVLKAERAWMTPVKVDQHLVVNGDQLGGISFYAKWINSGRSPALQAGMWCAMRIEPRHADYPFFERINVPDNAIVGQGATVNSASRTISGQEFIDFMDGRLFVYFYSFVNYKDVFTDSVRKTEFCIRISFVSIIEKPDGRRELRFEMFNIGEQNNAT